MQVMPPRLDDPAAHAEQRARRGNRRRLVVFLSVFVVALAAGQAWNFSRPLEYRTSSRIRLQLPNAGGPGAAASSAFAGRIQIVDSRPVLEQVARKLAQGGHTLPAQGDEGVTRLQSMLTVSIPGGADVVQLVASGDNPALLAALLNGLPEVLAAELSAGQARAADEQLKQAQQELARLERTSQERRARLEQFRNQAGLLAERDENEAVARSRGLQTALNNAIEKEAAAEAKLRAVSEGIPVGRSGLQARDDPTLASLESRASQAREELRDMERVYTPAFMAMDPRARALRARLAELERQTTQQRSAGQQTALRVAQEEAATAHAAVERLKAQLAAVRPALQGVSGRFAQARIFEDDLAQVEKARREMLERVARLEADERRRVPVVTVLEPAAVPATPWRPDRQGDGLYVLGGSLLLALLAMGIVELFNRAPAVVPAAPNNTTVLLGSWNPAAALPGGAGGAAALLGGAMPGPQALPAPQVPVAAPLRQPEAAALLAAAQGDTRWVCAAGLLGLSAQELLALRGSDVDRTLPGLTVRGPNPRRVPLPAWVADLLPAAEPDAPLLSDATGASLPESELQTMLACAALDAGLPHGASLGFEELRHTCIDWLLGQGLRFSELTSMVGRVDMARVAALAGRGAEGMRRSAAEVEFTMPALLAPPPSA